MWRLCRDRSTSKPQTIQPAHLVAKLPSIQHHSTKIARYHHTAWNDIKWALTFFLIAPKTEKPSGSSWNLSLIVSTSSVTITTSFFSVAASMSAWHVGVQALIVPSIYTPHVSPCHRPLASPWAPRITSHPHHLYSPSFRPWHKLPPVQRVSTSRHLLPEAHDCSAARCRNRHHATRRRWRQGPAGPRWQGSTPATRCGRPFSVGKKTMATTKTCAEKGASWAALAELFWANLCFPGWRCKKLPTKQRLI